MDTEPNNLPVVASAFTVSPSAAFTDGTDGKPRLAWARYQGGMWGYSALGGNVSTIASYGSRHERERHQAAAIANELATSNPVIATVLENLTTTAVGTGLTLSAKPDWQALGLTDEQGRALSHAFETGWHNWANNPLECDQSGRFTVHQMAGSAFRNYLLSGEVAFVLNAVKYRNARTRTKVCMLSPAQIDHTITGLRDNWHVWRGVAFDQSGRRVGYYMKTLTLGAMVIEPMAKFVPAFTSWGRPVAVHIFDQLDPQQVRGLSPLTPALTPAHERESASEFVLANFLLQTQFALTVESELPPTQAFGGLEVNHQFGGMDQFIQLRDQWYTKAKLNPSPGTVNHMAPGDKLKFNYAENPSATYAEFDKSLTRRAARAAGDSFEAVSGDFSQTSFSASRMAMAIPGRVNARRRAAILQPFYAAIYRAWLEEAIEAGGIELPDGAPPFWTNADAYCCAKFLGEGNYEPDPRKAAEADVLNLENCLETLEDVLGRKGRDLESHLAQVAAERKLLAKYGLTLPGAVVTQQKNEVIETDKSESKPTPEPAPSPVNLPNKRNRK